MTLYSDAPDLLLDVVRAFELASHGFDFFLVKLDLVLALLQLCLLSFDKLVLLCIFWVKLLVQFLLFGFLYEVL